MLRIAWVVHLLGILIGIMLSSIQRAGATAREKWNCRMALKKISASINSRIVDFLLTFGFSKMVFMSFSGWNFVSFWSTGTPWYFFSVFFWQVWQRSVDSCNTFMKGRKSFHICTNFVYPMTVYHVTSAACLYDLQSSALVVEVGRSLIWKLL